MKVLVINCGSSTLKFQFIQTRGCAVERKLARGVVDRIGGGEDNLIRTYDSLLHPGLAALASKPIQGTGSCA